MIRFQIQKRGFPQMQQSLGRVSKLNRDPMREMYEELSKGLSDMVKDAFQRRFDPQRGARRWKRKVDGTPATLIRSGRMFRALTSPQAWQQLGPKKMMFNPSRSAFYWRFHQEGTRTLPRRGVLPAVKNVDALMRRVFGRELEIRWR